MRITGQTSRVIAAAIALALLLVPTAARAQSWTAPRTWVHAELVTETELNQQIRDNELILKTSISNDGTTWTGTFNGGAVTGSGALTLASLGNGMYKFGTSTLADGLVNIVGDALGNNVLGIKAAPAGQQRMFFVEDSSGALQLQIWNDGAVTVGASSLHPSAGAITATGTITSTGFGTHGITAAGTGLLQWSAQNTTAGTTMATRISAGSDISSSQSLLDAYSSTYTTNGPQVQAGTALGALGAGGLSIWANNASGVIRFYTGGSTLRWGVNAAGDFTFGTSSYIADSSGTPTISTGFGTSPSIAGTDYAVVVTLGSGGPVSGTVAFGHTFSHAPACVATAGGPGSAAQILLLTVTTTTVKVDTVSTMGSAGAQVNFICRGY